MQINQLYSNVLIVFSLINLLFAFIFWKKVGLRKESSKYYLFLSLAISLYTFGYSQEILQTNLTDIKFWLKFQYIGGSFVPSLWFLVLLELSGHSKLTNKYLKNFVLFIGVLILIVFFTNDFHHLYYATEEIKKYNGFSLMNAKKGILYAFVVFFELSCNFYAFFISINILLKENNHLKKQYILLLLSSLVMGAAFFLNITGWSPYAFDYLPIGSICFQLFLGLSIFKYGLINYVPIAYEFVIKNMKEGLLVVDREGAVVNYNEAFTKITNISKKSIGLNISKLEIYELGLKKFFDNKISYAIDKESLNCNIGDKYYKINYTLVGDESSTYAWVFLFYDVTEEQEYIKKMEYYATYDSLTGLYNRRAFYEKGNELLKKETNKGQSISAIVYDFDYFKLINDTFSHDAGDLILQFFGKQVLDSLNLSENIVGRLGGEEFAILLYDYNLSEAQILAEKLRQNIEKTKVPYEDFELTITGSFGIAELNTGEELKNLLKRADRALYKAKENGRNRVELY